jgi:hypothetical protein
MRLVPPCSLAASLHCLSRNLVLEKPAVQGVRTFHEFFNTRAVQLYLAKGHKDYCGPVLGPHF